MVDRTGRTALVTGGSVGIGRGVARRFLEAGMRVMVTGRDGRSLDDAREALGPDAVVVASDAGDLGAIHQLREHVVTAFGGLDVLVLNAGVGAAPAPFADLTEHRFDETLAVNVKGPFFAAQTLGDLLRPGGAIVLTTSISNTMGRTGKLDYDASKAALRSLTRSLAAEFLPRDAASTRSVRAPRGRPSSTGPASHPRSPNGCGRRWPSRCR
jgi:NAD(P)-dependent dehydrogenase (short-subunit alcohol dehydrogenase family)